MCKTTAQNCSGSVQQSGRLIQKCAQLLSRLPCSTVVSYAIQSYKACIVCSNNHLPHPYFCLLKFLHHISFGHKLQDLNFFFKTPVSTLNKLTLILFRTSWQVILPCFCFSLTWMFVQPQYNQMKRNVVHFLTCSWYAAVSSSSLFLGLGFANFGEENPLSHDALLSGTHNAR